MKIKERRDGSFNETEEGHILYYYDTDNVGFVCANTDCL